MSPRESTGDLVPLGVATRAWFRVSLQTFGGPAGQIAVMHRELVDERRWIGERRFLHALSYCTLLPGPEAQQLAIYLGWLLNGTAGGLIAGILFVLPGFVAIMALSVVYAGWGETLAVTALFAGVAPAVLAIVAQAVVRVERARPRPAARSDRSRRVPRPGPLRRALPSRRGRGRRRRLPPRPPPPQRIHALAHVAPDPEAPVPLIPDDALHAESRSGSRDRPHPRRRRARSGASVVVLGVPCSATATSSSRRAGSSAAPPW